MRIASNIVANGEPFWTADGIGQSAQLETGGAVMVDPSNLYIAAILSNNWQGLQTLYNFPRSNLCPNSETIGGTGWTNIQSVITLNALPSPSGSATGMSLIKANASVTAYSQSTTINVVGGGLIAVNAYVTYSNSTTCGVSVYNSAVTTLIAAQNVSFTTGGVASLGSATTVAKPSILTNLGNGLYKVTIFVNLGAPAAIKVLAYPDRNNSGAATYFWGVDVRQGFAPDSYVPNYTASIVPVTDWAQGTTSSTLDIISFGQLPLAGTQFTWNGTATTLKLDYQQTMLAQYANSPIMCALIQSFNDAIDPTLNIDAFFSTVWDISQCVGVGLDIWGRIVNVPRTIVLTASPTYLGYEEALPTSFTFNAQPMYTGPVQGQQYTLNDDAYRVLIMTKALANISSFTAPSMNKLLNFMFNGQGGPPRGSCYVLELSPMQIEYVFNFHLTTWEASILSQPALMPRPAGVGVSIISS